MAALGAVEEQGGPGIVAYTRDRAIALARGEELEPDTTLSDLYIATLDQLNAISSECTRCRRPISDAYVDAGPLGHYHKECYRG